MKLSQNLPIEAAIPDIKVALAAGLNVVLEAPPGAGKTTIVPLALMDEAWLDGKRIVMLEPRRLAARAAAYRLSYLFGSEVGNTVGYRTRLDSKTGPLTRIEVVTEGILTRFLQEDPAISDVGLIIFDEFHERSVHADLGLALAVESRSVLREDLRIIVMSATLDGMEVATLLEDARVIKTAGRAYPVDLRYLEARGPRRFEELSGPEFISKVVAAVLRALKEEEGSVLVFLPGSGEIRRVESGLIDRVPPEVEVSSLYGELSRELQDRALRPSPPGRRKVVLATSIAETSLTIDGIRIVIDGGLKRISRFSPSTGMSRLETIRVTRDSAEQRAGRAGRLEPGVCYRLWDERENCALRQRNTPEIMEADLAPLALNLAVWGVKDPLKLRWLDPPPDGAMTQAKEILRRLGAMDSDDSATVRGKEISKLPLHPRLTHMALKGNDLGLGDLACYLSALLSERDFLRVGSVGADSDIRHRLEILLGRSRSQVDHDRNSCERVKAMAQQLKKTFGIRDSSDDVEKAGLLLAFAFPDRIARRRTVGEGRYLLSNGRGAYFRGKDALSKEDYIVAASIDGGERESQIFLAAPVKLTDLDEYFAGDIIDSQNIAWDQAEGAVIARRQRKLWSLVLSDVQIQKPDGEAVLEALLSGLRQNGLGILPWDEAATNLKARINLLNRMSGVTGIVFPYVSDNRLLETIGAWLAPCIAGMTRLEHLKKLDMSAVISGILNREERQALDRLAPTHLTVPSGSRIRIDYAGGERPVLAVRIQEVLGLAVTPAIANGKLPLLLHLLSPAGRPVQVTEDLAGFWTNSYPMVRKELKGRYPKHYWPDDPAAAQATKGAKRRGIGE